jgi:hypothetical protein
MLIVLQITFDNIGLDSESFDDVVLIPDSETIGLATQSNLLDVL